MQSGLPRDVLGGVVPREREPHPDEVEAGGRLGQGGRAVRRVEHGGVVIPGDEGPRASNSTRSHA